MSDKENFETQISYVLGLVSIVVAFISPLAGLIAGIIGFTQSKKQKTELSRKARKFSLVGIIISAIILALVIIAFIYTVITTGGITGLPAY